MFNLIAVEKGRRRLSAPLRSEENLLRRSGSGKSDEVHDDIQTSGKEPELSGAFTCGVHASEHAVFEGESFRYRFLIGKKRFLELGERPSPVDRHQAGSERIIRTDRQGNGELDRELQFGELVDSGNHLHVLIVILLRPMLNVSLIEVADRP